MFICVFVSVCTIERKEKMSFTVKDLEKQATFYTIVRQLRESPGTKMSLGDYLSTTKSLYGLSGEESRSLLTEMTKLGLVMHLPSVHCNSCSILREAIFCVYLMCLYLMYVCIFV